MTEEQEVPTSENNNSNNNNLIDNNNLDSDFLLPLTSFDKIQFVIDVIEKETKRETKLVKHLVNAGFSTYTNDPINLLINSRKPGEGKTHPIVRVLSYFPNEDVIILSGSSDKALYHEKGPLVIRDEETERWVPIAPQLEELEAAKLEVERKYEDKAISRVTRDDQLSEIKSKRDSLLSKSSKLISLEHKILVFLDTPNTSLLEAIMPLLSHDAYESKYKFSDKKNGGKIESTDNVLWGWPTVIFAQTIDMSHRKRFPELSRRFIIINPNTSQDKVIDAVGLAVDRSSLPDISYQREVCTDREKSKVRSIIRDLKLEFLEFSKNLRKADGTYDKDKSPVLGPFDFALKNAMPKNDMNDVTNTSRFTRFQRLSTITNVDRRPIIRLSPNEKALDPTTANAASTEDLKKIVEIPITVFADTEKAIELMQDSTNTGLRPEQSGWYSDVFLKKYQSKSKPDEKERENGKIVKEDRIALTVKDLVKATNKYRNETISTRMMREYYLDSLYNNGVIDKVDSQIDKRSDIWFPVTALIEEEEQEEKNKKLERKASRSNFLEGSVLHITDSSKYPTKEAIKSRIQTHLRYYAEAGYTVQLLDGRETRAELDDIITVYFSDDHAQKCFKLDSETRQEEKRKKDYLSGTCLAYYFGNGENGDDLQESKQKDAIPIESEAADSSKLERDAPRSNFLYNGNGRTEPANNNNGNSSEVAISVKPELVAAFWDAFDLLVSQKQPEPDGRVNKTMLRQTMISSGKFDAGSATQTVEEMLDSGQVRTLEFDILCKN